MEIQRIRLVEEVRKRPKLWAMGMGCSGAKLWAEVADILQTDANKCKHTWQLIRIRFRGEAKRMQTRIAKAKEEGTYDPNLKYTNWHLFDKLKFIDTVKSGYRGNYETLDVNTDVRIESETTAKKIIDSIPKNTNIDSCTSFNQDPGLQIESGTDSTVIEDIGEFKVIEIKSSLVSTPEPSHCFKPEHFAETHNGYQNHETSSLSTTQMAMSPDTSDEEYSFLYSFVAQTKQMTPLQKMEFHVEMKTLLLNIFPATASVNILEKQLLLSDSDDDPDRKFLISFWPFLKSMSLSENLKFRAETAKLVLSILSTGTRNLS